MSLRAVCAKEVRSLTVLPQTYAIAAGFTVISGLFFLTFLFQHELPDLEQYYSNIASTLLVVAPIVAMRSFADERRSGALELVTSWPVSRSALAWGRYVVNVAFTWLLLSISWWYVVLLSGMTELELGKMTAGFVTLALLAAAVSALALAVSARASSGPTAAFVGFGVLLGLWTLQFAPRWLGESGLGVRVADLSPATHLEAGARGVLDGGDIAYFAICVVLGLGLTVDALESRRPGSTRHGRRGSQLRLGAAMLAGLAVWGAASGTDWQVDLTPTQRFTVTSLTRAIAERSPEPIRVVGFFDPDSAAAVEVRALIDSYRAADIPIELELVDPDVNPGRARELGVVRYQQLLVQIGDRRELVGDPNQIEVTSAILRLTRKEPLTACFTVGHGEPDVDDRSPTGYAGFREALHRLGVQSEKLALAAPAAPARLGRCSLVVTSPQVGFLTSEVSLLRGYLEAEGRVLVMADPDEAARAQLNDLLRPWGVVLGPGRVRDRSALADDPAAVVAFEYLSENPVVRELKRAGIPVLVPSPRPVERTLEAATEAWTAPLLGSSSHSWLLDTDRKGPFVLAAAVDASSVVKSEAGDEVRATRIAIVGSPDVASNRLLDVFGNHEFATGLVQWVARESDVIAAGRDYGGVRKLVLTRARRDRLVRLGLVVPSFFALVPLPAVALRLRRG